jgi:hypothetical protein
MKSVFLIISGFTFFGSLANACPNLSGNYMMTFQNEHVTYSEDASGNVINSTRTTTEETHATQVSQAGCQSLSIDGKPEFLLDGVTRTSTFFGVTMKVTGKVDGNNIVEQVETTDQRLVYEFSLDSTGNLVTHGTQYKNGSEVENKTTISPRIN